MRRKNQVSIFAPNKVKALSLGLSLALILGLASCGKDDPQNPTPDQPTVTTPANDELKTLLATPANGWEAVIYPSNNQSVGGYTLFVKFDKAGTLSAGSELLESAELSTSTFELEEKDGVKTLRVKEFNKALRLGSTEVENAANPFAELARFGVDESYTVEQATAELVTLKGKTSGSILTLKPADSAAWSEQLAAIKQMRQDVSITSFLIQSGDRKLGTGELTVDKRHLVLVENSGATASYPYRYTAKGIELFRVAKVGTLSVQAFNFVSSPESVELQGEAFSLKAQAVPLANIFQEGLFSFDLSTMSDNDRAYRSYNRFVNRMTKTFTPAFTIKSTKIGLSNGVFGAHVSMHRAADPLTKQPAHDIDYVIPMTLRVDSPTEISLSMSVDKIEEGSVAYQYTLIESNTYHTEMMIGGFANIGRVQLAPSKTLIYNESYNPRSFTLSADNPYKPTKIILTDKALTKEGNPASVITLNIPTE